MKPVRIAQIGTKHGHAMGKLRSLMEHPGVELAGVYEPDPVRRRQLADAGELPGGLHWFDRLGDVLDDASVAAVAAEGRNDESLAQVAAAVAAGKHVWYDKPAGDDWQAWLDVAERARAGGLLIQMGYMFRYHHGFRQIGEWVQGGLLGRLFKVRAQMSTRIGEEQRRTISRHRGGIFYDLAGHMLDQIVWLLGRPTTIQAIMRHDDMPVTAFADNTVAVLEFEEALAIVDIAAMEPRPMARRFEVYGMRGSAIMEPFEPAGPIRLCLEEPVNGYAQGTQFVQVAEQSRQALYDLELAAFLAALRGTKQPDRSLDHESLVQETLLRITRGLGQ